MDRVYGFGFAVGDRVVITAVVNSVERWAVGLRGTVRYVSRSGNRRRMDMPRDAATLRVEVECPPGYDPPIRELRLTHEHVRLLDVIEQIGELPT